MNVIKINSLSFVAFKRPFNSKGFFPTTGPGEGRGLAPKGNVIIGKNFA